MAHSNVPTAESISARLSDGFDDYVEKFWERYPHLGDITIPPSELWDVFRGSSEWLIDGVVPSGLTVLYGEPGVGKSGLALDWALSIATGQHWLGHPVKQLDVYYIHADEGASGLLKRIAAWQQHRGVTAPDDRIRFIPRPIKLNDEEQLGAVFHELDELAQIQRARKERPFTPGVIFVDTVAASMAGSDSEGGAVESWLHASQRLRARTMASLIALHHPGLKGGRMRGHSSLYGAATAVYELDGPRGSLDIAPIRLSVDKAPRDGDSFGEMRLRRRKVEIVDDEAERQQELAVQNDIRRRSGAPLLEALPARTFYIIERNEDAVVVPSVKPDPIVGALTAAGPKGLPLGTLEATTGLRGGSLDRRLKSLMKEGQITRVRRGVYAIAQ